MVRQDLGGRENAEKRRDGVSGVTRRFHETHSKQDGKCTEEVNEPGGRQHIDE